MALLAPTEPRLLLRRLHGVVAGPGDAQTRLNRIVTVIAEDMAADVCSVYLVRAGVLELFATEGLNKAAVHATTLKIGEGLVGLIAEHARPLALSEASRHPNFAFRPETGEEAYHSLMGVPVLRGGRVVGVVVVQHRQPRDYHEDEIEAMQTVAMVMAEMVGGGDLLAGGGARFLPDGAPARLVGLALNEGLCRGVVVMHRPRVIVEHHIADDPGREHERLQGALTALREQVEGFLNDATAETIGESREILETYRMFAQDRGWIARMREEVDRGLTAEAAVERVQADTRARMSEISDPYLRERLYDLEDLSNRMLRHLTGQSNAHGLGELPANAVLVARNMGPAELLDYDQDRIVGLLLEDGSPTSHVAIVAKALRLPVLGRVERLLDAVEPGDTVLVDAEHGQLFLRPSQDVIEAFSANISVRQAREAEYAALRDAEAVTLDGVEVTLSMNAGLLIDLPHLDETGASSIGLYRTELQFMVRSTVPTVEQQRQIYRRVLDYAGERAVVFRTLDVGGDKMLPYLARHDDEQNPAMGWRAIRLSLDRPGLLRMQLRALLRAAAGTTLNVMFPMIAEVAEFVAAKALFERERERLLRLGEALPTEIRLGTMLEVPSLAWQLPALLEQVDFVSIGSNDLMQFLFASDRGNPRLSDRYDVLSPAALSLLRDVVRLCDEAEVPVSLCGEAAGRPIEAMALLGIGLRGISMNAAAVGRVKKMVRSLNLAQLSDYMRPLLDSPEHSIRPRLESFASEHDVSI